MSNCACAGALSGRIRPVTVSPFMHAKRRPSASYVAAHHSAYLWANKALAYRRAGKSDQAQAAAERAHNWLRKIEVMETQVVLH